MTTYIGYVAEFILIYLLLSFAKQRYYNWKFRNGFRYWGNEPKHKREPD